MVLGCGFCYGDYWICYVVILWSDLIVYYQMGDEMPTDGMDACGLMLWGPI